MGKKRYGHAWPAAEKPGNLAKSFPLRHGRARPSRRVRPRLRRHRWPPDSSGWLQALRRFIPRLSQPDGARGQSGGACRTRWPPGARSAAQRASRARSSLGVRHAGEGGHALARAARPRAPPYTHAARADRHLCGAGCAGLSLASVCRGQSRRSWAAEGVILRCRWPRLRVGALAGADGSASARVAADARSSGTLLGGGRLARPRWDEAAERPTQVAWAEPVASTAGTEGETPSGRALGCVSGSCGVLYFLVLFSW